MLKTGQWEAEAPLGPLLATLLGMLEAKGTGANVYKKKIYTYIFLRRSPKKGLQKFFSDDLQKRTQKRSSKIFREVSGVLQHNFNGAKNSAVFLRTGGFEAKAKAKAKDFKMCPRGQRRPRELHLCLEYKSNQIFYYTRCNTPERVTSWRGPSPPHCARTTQLLSKMCRSGGEPLQHYVRFDQPRFELLISRSRDERATARSIQ